MFNLRCSYSLRRLPVEAADTTPRDLACGSDRFLECGHDWAFDSPLAGHK